MMLPVIAAAVLLALGLLYILWPKLFVVPILLILYCVNPGQKPHRRGKPSATGPP